MKKRIPTLLATMIATALYSQQGLAADLASQCMLGVPSYDRPLVQGDTNDLPVTINADHAKGDYPDDAVFTGSVDIMQGNSRLQADEVQLHQKQAEGQPEPVRTVDALGNVHYDDNQVILKGPKGWSNLNTKDTNIWEGDYQMVGRQGRGKADLMKQRGENRYTILENGSFTSCLPGSDTWSVVGSEVIHDREEQVAEIWNARFKLGPVPIFYSPYLQLPVGDKRRSGFLIPNAKYSTSNYFEFYLPYYWNIAPNMDATITPHYMHRRGNIMWENEFRYLSQAGAGLMELDYLPSDKVYQDDVNNPSGDNRHRWMFYWRHDGVMDQVWRFNVDYTKVSDTSYTATFTVNGKTVTVNLRELKKKLYLCLMSVNALEAIRFYVSFACSFAFAERELMEGNAKIIKMIARDEALHLTGTQHMLNLMRSGNDDPDMAEIAVECEQACFELFKEAALQEKEWAEYLFQDGSMIGLNKDILCQYVEYITNLRMAAVGLQPAFAGTKQNPIPWINTWLSSDNVQVAPQEVEVSSYLVGQIDSEVHADDLGDFEL